ncbi:pirin family protein [Corynebacterium vitaeruminis]|uniref:Pirin family protein n=1 Tax=Corynebacterium vitaeruminis DSM 20294 TaxID=1224164 RepID=W5YA25_9CORY|nr:pirin family protein [Corynebacterium vitaeruminis]AHI23363.1 hypothetical protein B843_09890 [Corynebacterium vitaeruminis DSM 20294]
MVNVEIIAPRDVPLGGLRSMEVRRTLPHRARPTIGAWCFIDHYGPERLTMDVAPHPHSGLQTVSWLFDGHISHHDSAGHHLPVRPGELVLMTAGRGISHSEVAVDQMLHGAQLWTALPDAHRFDAPRVDRYRPAPVEADGATLLVFLGTLAGSTSPVRAATPLVGAEIRLPAGTRLSLPVNESFEHGVLVDSGRMAVEKRNVHPGELAYTGVGASELLLEAETDSRALLLGGEPFQEEFVMWWNFLGRTHEEVAEYQREWNAGGGRFGVTEGYENPLGGLGRIPAPQLPTVRMRPRRLAEPVARLR